MTLAKLVALSVVAFTILLLSGPVVSLLGGASPQARAAALNFGKATMLPISKPGTLEFSTTVSSNGLELYYYEQRGPSSFAMAVSRRNSIDEEFSTSTPVNVNMSHVDLSRDGLSLYGHTDTRELAVTRRSSLNDAFTDFQTELLGPAVNNGEENRWITVSADELEIYFARGEGFVNNSLWVARRNSKAESFGAPSRMPEKINAGGAATPDISADGLTLFFTSSREGGFGESDIWASMRSSTSDSWGDPVNLGASVNTPGWDWQPDISADGRTLYFSSIDGPLEELDYDIWQARLVPEPSCAALASICSALLLAGGWRLKRQIV